MIDPKRSARRAESGQSLVEYALIFVLVIAAFGAAIAATGPVIGNIFSNTVYNLLGEAPEDVADLPDVEGFWMTVTWVATQTPQETPLATRTLPPPTLTPTPGPSPTYTPVTPTRTPTPTFTPPPSPTPVDIHHEPEPDGHYIDSADEEIYWRLGDPISFGTDGWYARFYDNETLTGAPVWEDWITELDEDNEGYDLDFNWGGSKPVVTMTDSNQIGARFTRRIRIQGEPVRMRFNFDRHDDGVRLWILGGSFGGNAALSTSLPTSDPGNCSSQTLAWEGRWDENYLVEDFTFTVDDSTGNVTDMPVFIDGGDHAPNLRNPDLAQSIESANPLGATTVTSGGEVGENADKRTNEVDDAGQRLEVWEPVRDNAFASNNGDRTLTNDDNRRLIYDDDYFGFDYVQYNNDGGETAGNTIPDDCLLYDRWLRDAQNDVTIVRTIPPGTYTLQLDWHDWSGDAEIDFDFQPLRPTSVNVSDSSSNPSFPSPSCNWGQSRAGNNTGNAGNNSNSAEYMWEEFVGGSLFQQQACHLELRGSVRIDESWDNPVISFWDIWDFTNNSGNVSADLEVALYDEAWVTGTPPLTSDNLFNSESLDWITVSSSPLHSTNTANYNWTYHNFDLNEVFYKDDDNDGTPDVDLRGQRITYRFRITTQDWTSTAPNRRWYIDTIRIENKADPPTYGMATTWDLDDMAQKDNFITSAHWDLTSQRPFQGAGMSWETTNSESGMDNPPRFSEGINSATGAPDVNLSTDNYRVHSLEINGWINTSRSSGANAANTDEEGDEGDAILSFQHAYDIDDWHALEVQYTFDGYDVAEPNWQPIPGRWLPDNAYTDNLMHAPTQNADWDTVNAGFTLYDRTATEANGGTTTFYQPPAGVLVHRGNNQEIEATDLVRVEIPLEHISSTDQLFRLRFAYMVHPGADTQKDGWWIDEIKLERTGAPEFTPYPVYDNAEIDTRIPTELNRIAHIDWQFGGTFGPEEGGFGGEADNPGTAYSDSINDTAQQDGSMALLHPIDMRSDTPSNIASQGCPGGPYDAQCKDPADRQAPAEDPVLSFMHRRLLGTSTDGSNFTVEWAQADDPTNWRVLWNYDAGYTFRTNNDDQIQKNVLWEPIVVDLRPVMQFLEDNNDTTSTTEDDVIFRINYTDGSNSGSSADGIYIDEFRIEERTPPDTWQLWTDGANASAAVLNDTSGFQALDDDGNVLAGDGIVYFNGLDNELGQPTFTLSGTWGLYDRETRDGLFALHDSVTNPDGEQQTESEPFGQSSAIVDNTNDGYSVAELNTIFDLRGVHEDDRPMLTFWSRYDMGDNHNIRVQLAYEMPLYREIDGTTPDVDQHDCPSGLPQCYEHLYGVDDGANSEGWSSWRTIWPIDNDTNPGNNESAGEAFLNRSIDSATNHAWNREMVDLSEYARRDGADGSDLNDEGRRIRLRFVSNTLAEPGNPGDGWYIDNIALSYRQPDVQPIRASGGGGTESFTDSARGVGNWIMEGRWGLSPEFFRGSESAAITLGSGFWDAYWWDLSDECNATTFPDCADTELSNNANDTADDEQETFDIRFEFGANGPDGLSVTDEFAGRFERIVAATQDVEYTFITTSDDGVRAKYIEIENYDPIDGSYDIENADPDNNGVDDDWNIINNWTVHERVIDIGYAPVQAGRTYLFTIEYFDLADDAALLLTTGGNRFSFTDNPKQGSGPAFPEVPALPNSSSSMIYDGLFDLTAAEAPILTYYTYYELGGTARVEVSTDGGFYWTEDGLRGTTVDEGIWMDRPPASPQNFDTFAASNDIPDAEVPDGVTDEDTPEAYGIPDGYTSLPEGYPLVFNDFPYRESNDPTDPIEVFTVPADQRDEWVVEWFNDTWNNAFVDNEAETGSLNFQRNVITDVDGDIIEMGRPNMVENLPFRVEVWEDNTRFRMVQNNKPVADANGIDVPDDQYSARFTRFMRLDEPTTFDFEASFRDGVRLWIWDLDQLMNQIDTVEIGGEDVPVFELDPIQCAYVTIDGNLVPLAPGTPQVRDDDADFDDPSTSCLLMEYWYDDNNDGNRSIDVTRTIPAGRYMVQVDFYEWFDGGSEENDRIIFDIREGDFDDPSYNGDWMPTNNSGNPREWRERNHSLAAYAGANANPVEFLALRFRLDRIGEDVTNSHNQSPTNWNTGWWITDISLIDP